MPAATGAYSKAAAQTTAGLQKWVLTGGTWKLAYTLRTGLNLGQPYTIAGYPTGNNPATELPWAPATDGLHNITGRVNPDGTVTVWAVTSTLRRVGECGPVALEPHEIPRPRRPQVLDDRVLLLGTREERLPRREMLERVEVARGDRRKPRFGHP